jgi:hypothetical protein
MNLILVVCSYELNGFLFSLVVFESILIFGIQEKNDPWVTRAFKSENNIIYLFGDQEVECSSSLWDKRKQPQGGSTNH